MSFDFQPTLSGPSLTLRPLAADDFAALYAVASDPLIWELHPMNDRYQLPVFQKLFDESIVSGGALVVIEKASGTIIGSSRFSVDIAGEDEVEIGWSYLARSHWGGAFNREKKHLMLTYAFTGFPTVIFRIGENNLRSRRAVEKIGGRLTDRRQILQLSGREIAPVFYAIRRVDFAELI